MHRQTAFPLLGALVLTAAVTVAEEAPPGPPGVIAFTREEIKPGRMGAHEKSAAHYVAVLAKTNAAQHRVGLVPVSGDTNQVMYLEGYRSFADMEAAQSSFDTALAATPGVRAEMDQIEREGFEQHDSQRTAIARYRADLSYRPNTVADVGKARYMSIATIRIKPGRGPDWVDHQKALNAAREKAGIGDVHVAVYQATAGALGGTYYTFTSYGSLKEMDDSFAGADARNQAIDAAIGGGEIVKQRRLLISDIMVSNESNLYAMNAKISRPTAVMAAADPDFWQPPAVKEATGKALAAKKSKP